MTADERRRVGGKWLMVPAFWLMISYAAWRAVIELKTNPFFWSKTPHRASQPASGATEEREAGMMPIGEPAGT